MTTPAGDGNTPHRAQNLFDDIDLASNTMKVCFGSPADLKLPSLRRPLRSGKLTPIAEFENSTVTASAYEQEADVAAGVRRRGEIVGSGLYITIRARRVEDA